MLRLFILTISFTIVAAISIVLIGSRKIIEGNMSFARIVQIIFDWRFIIGAIFAFFARIFFVMINNKIYQIPHLANSSTTITALITAAATAFVIVTNYYFLGERINLIQGIGAFLILLGIWVILR